MNRPRLVFLTVFFSFAVVAPFTAGGSTIVALKLEELTVRSARICVGEVLESRGVLEDGRIRTVHRVKVTRSVFDTPELAPAQGKEDIIEVVTAGGRVGKYGQKVFGAAELQVGQRYLLFLRKRSTQIRPVGMFQGVYRVVEDGAGQTHRILPSRASVRLVAPPRQTGGELVERRAWLERPAMLHSVIDRINLILEKNK